MIPSLPDLIRQSMWRLSMDHRVKPGGDDDKVTASCPHLLRASTSCLRGSKDVDGRDMPGHDDRSYRYLKAIRSVRLSVEAAAFEGSFAAFELC